MLETLREWLNGSREYYSGVAIYASVGKNQDLLDAFTQGLNDIRYRRLEKELLAICTELKSQKNIDHGNSSMDYSHNPEPDMSNVYSFSNQKKTGANKKDKVADQGAGGLAPATPNAELWQACKLAADKLFKLVMNKRAQLFALAQCESWENANLPHKIEERSKLAIDVVTEYQQISQLYDRADYVKINGRLPDQDDAEGETAFEHLPDALVKKTLDNLRKNYNKIIKRDQTPERVALLQKHKATIEKLEVRWHLLQPK